MDKAPGKFKYRLGFNKKDNMVFISHLDVMTLFRRALRRADLPFVMTRGFSPRVKISLPKALKLGIESESEEFFLELEKPVDPCEIKKLLNNELPEGIKILSVEIKKT